MWGTIANTNHQNYIIMSLCKSFSSAAQLCGLTKESVIESQLSSASNGKGSYGDIGLSGKLFSARYLCSRRQNCAGPFVPYRKISIASFDVFRMKRRQSSRSRLQVTTQNPVSLLSILFTLLSKHMEPITEGKTGLNSPPPYGKDKTQQRTVREETAGLVAVAGQVCNCQDLRKYIVSL